jgi:hypothetical protein
MTMFPIHALVFTLWFIMAGPSFISSGDSFQEVVTFSTLAIQKPFADVQTFLFVKFCELLWDPSCRLYGRHASCGYFHRPND